MSLRRILRRTLPVSARVRLRALRRQLADRRRDVSFASARRDRAEFPSRVAHYVRPLICYPGQESSLAAKRNNLTLALAAIDRLVVHPGEMFSFWQCLGRPTASAGYQEAAAIREGALVRDVGGAICLASTLIYNVGLLAGMTIEERWCHSVDSYGDARYFELGRDAAVEYAYRDLRMRNDLQVPLMLCAWVCDDLLCAEALAPAHVPLDVAVAVSVEDTARTLRASMTRTVRLGDADRTDDSVISTYGRPSADS